VKLPPLHDEETQPLVFWPTAVLGAVIVLYGLVRWAPWDSSLGLDPYIRWTVGLAVFHDLVFAPLVGLAGWLVGRAAPPSIRAPLQGGLIVAGIVTLFAIPSVRGWGRSSNETILPRNYATGLTVVLLLVAAGTALACAWSWRQHRHAGGGR
jgi:hypothetical protein